MTFNGLTFIFWFLPIFFFLYYLIKDQRIRNILLLIGSLFFYAWGEPVYILLMLIITVLTYIIGLLINKFDKQKKYSMKKTMLLLSILMIIGALGFYKYSDFFILNINQIFNAKIKLLDLPLPLGISFYSFQILTYIFDLYMNKIKVQKNIFYLLLYVSLFPKIMVGPIVKYSSIEKQLYNQNITFDDVVYGIKRFIVGLAKKVIIANQMAMIANNIYDNNLSSAGTFGIWLAAFAYALQIYYDFSGYSDMAIGIGRMLGFNFTENFNFPYIAKSITDFWRRWHISLSTWFRDYIYIPLGGNRVTKLKWIRNIFVVWMLTGFWHGANWNYIIWGLYFAIILLFEKLFFQKYLDKSPSFVKWIYSFILILIGWVIFRNEDINVMFMVLKMMFSWSSTNLVEFVQAYPDAFYYSIFFIPAIIFMVPTIKICEKQKTTFKNIIYNGMLLMLFVLSIMFLLSSTYTPFVYFKF